MPQQKLTIVPVSLHPKNDITAATIPAHFPQILLVRSKRATLKSPSLTASMSAAFKQL
ncbi:hypothetical protein [Cytobacillus stercorigallinarum]|uniref:hypothetical protein n=1 Tax=Cytobacillus stercorigallinarum TaxID=2762240 RepID=UPI001CD8E785|nr:hypothetical protein [Cytobacillus stercorigallinarum]